MGRYIDAEALKVSINTAFWSEIGKIINSAPSIDLVFCKECIWRDTDNQGEDYCMYVKGLCDINESSFCSWGERKESE